MTNIYLFDVDGTLTPQGRAMTQEVATEFHKFAIRFPTFLATSQTYENLRDRIPTKILNACKGIYSCSGAEYSEKGTNIYRRQLLLSKILEVSCEALIKQSNFRYKMGSHIQRCPGAINVSVVGLKAEKAELLRYMIWDRALGEREKLIKIINESQLEYEAYLGNNTSICILPTDENKSAIAEDLFEKYPETKITFFGDRISEFGSDLPLAERLRKESIYHRVVSVGNHQHTKHHLKRMLSQSQQLAS